MYNISSQRLFKIYRGYFSKCLDLFWVLPKRNVIFEQKKQKMKVKEKKDTGRKRKRKLKK